MAGRVEIGVFLEGAQAEAEAAVIDQKLDNIGKSGASGANQARAGLNNLEKAARSTKDSIAAYDKEILDARSHLAQLGQQLVEARTRFGANSEQANVLKTKMAEVGSATRGLVAEKAILVAESKLEEAATNASTSAFSRKTTMLNTGQGALKGYDAALTGVIRSMGGINLGLAVGISLAAALLPKILDLISAKEKQIKIDKDQIDTDLRRNDIGERTTRIHADLITAFRIVASQQKEYTQNTRQLNHDLDELAKGSETRLIIDAKTGASYQQLNRNATELRQGVSELNEKLGEQEKVLQPALEVILRHKEATGQSTEATLEWANAIGHFAPDQIDFFRERLNALLPDIDEFTKKLNDLKAPRFDVSATLPGRDFLRASLQATFQLARDSGITDWAEQVRFATPALKALDEAIRVHAGKLANYRKELALLEPGERAAIALMHEQQKALNERDKRDAGLALEKEFLNARQQLVKQDFDERAKLIQREFELRREELKKTGQATEANLGFLKAIELTHLTILTNERVKYYEDIKRQRAQDLASGRESREKELTEFRLHLIKQRQVREEIEKEFFKLQNKEDFDTRSDRAGRARDEAEAIRTRNSAYERAIAIFGRLSQSQDLLAKQVDLANGKLSDQEAFLTAVRSAAELFVRDWIRSGAIFQTVADGISDSLRRMVANGEDFGKNMKAVFLDLISQLAAYWGRLFISMGAGMLFINPGAGIGLILAGTALLALSGVFAGLADRSRQAAAASGNSAAATAGSGGAAVAAGAPRAGVPPNVIPFPTSGPAQTVVVINRFDRGGMKAALRGEEFVTISDMRSNPTVQRTIKKVSTAA